MRICLEFNIRNSYLPLDYRRCFVSFIKKALSVSNNSKYLQQYYTDTEQKPFMFTIVMQKPKFGKEKVTFEKNKVKMYFSVTDKDRTSYIFTNCFLKMKYIDFPLPEGNVMCLVNVAKIKEKKITTDRVIFSTICSSSILVREHDKETNRDKYYTCEDESYKERLEESIRWQCLKEGYSDLDVEQIKVNEVVGKKVVIKNYNVLIDGVIGNFDISAPKHILNYLYTVGFGARKSFGFSYIDITQGEEERGEETIRK